MKGSAVHTHSGHSRPQKATKSKFAPEMYVEEGRKGGRKNAISSKYKMHKYLLYFLDPEVEQRYFDFQYVDNAFVPVRSSPSHGLV